MNYNKDGNQPDGNFDPEMTVAPRHLRGERTFNVGDVICGRYHCIHSHNGGTYCTGGVA